MEELKRQEELEGKKKSMRMRHTDLVTREIST